MPTPTPTQRRRSSMRTKLAAAFGSALLVPLLVVLGLQALDRTDAAQRWVDRGVQVRSAVRDVTDALLEAQLALASALTLGDTYPIADARAARTHATQALAGFARLTSADPVQRARIARLRQLLGAVVERLERSLGFAEAGELRRMRALLSEPQGRVAFVRLRQMLAALREHEEALIVAQHGLALERARTTRILLIVGGALAFILATLVILRIRASVTELEAAHETIGEQAAELAERARQLERSVKELDQFAYVASHDLKAPLRAIASLAAWIAEDAGDRLDDDGREHLRLMISRVERMDALVSGILAYARAGRGGLEAERIDLDALVREAVELVGPRPGVTVTVAGPLAPLRAPRVPLQQIWMNLLSNALKHGKHQDGHVVLGAEDGDDGPVYYVRDDGPGIDPRFHERIFTLFQTLEARDRVEGTGIGLSVVKKLVEQQGGRVWVESEPGAGTTFRFTYPPAPYGAGASGKR